MNNIPFITIIMTMVGSIAALLCGKRDKIRLAMMILAAVLIIAAAYVLQNAPNAVSNLLQ